MGRTRYLLLIVLILVAAATYVAMAGSEAVRNDRMVLRAGIHGMLINELSIKSAIPRGANAASAKSNTMIYVLGSGQEALKHHYRTAAALYKEGAADRIYILSRPGITEYSPALLRNLTNDEWSVRELGTLGVPAADVEAVPVPSGFFGTLREGRRISRFARERGYKRLVLVSSPHHGRRAHLTFSHFAGGTLEIFFQGSSDRAGLATLVAEYGKYLWYRRVLIPATPLSFHPRKGVPGSRNAGIPIPHAESVPDRISVATLCGT